MYTHKYHTDDLTDKTFLVTGGAGFIGSNLVEYLLKYGAKTVRVLDNFSTGSLRNLDFCSSDPRFELIEGDIRDISVCRKALDGIGWVSHQAALGSVPRSIDDPVTSNDVNVGGFLNMLVAARDAHVNAFVYAASSSTYGDHPGLPKVEDKIGRPLSPYAVTKYVNELYAQVFSNVYGFNTIGLRYFNVFGPKQNPNGPYAAVIPLFVQSALKGESPFINGDGETSRDFTFVENAVQANVKSLLATNVSHEVLNVAFGEATTLNQLWGKITDILGTSIIPIYRQERKGDVKHSLANIDRAKAVIGYVPRFSVLDGLEIALKWYQNQPADSKPDNP
ncbi:SDR family oxidoreductase [Pedobacter deserti]|uniref:SDR family oxidoreductase n=1 Tax=Pedobacter deserti TaxID=2817382 RepID=UPI00210896A6|nr:SDR family oxidoreductase [Pedobacter sp. SYSU D00382]